MGFRRTRLLSVSRHACPAARAGVRVARCACACATHYAPQMKRGQGGRRSGGGTKGPAWACVESALGRRGIA